MDEILEDRLLKLARLEKAGVDPYPTSFADGEDLSSLLEEGQALLPEEEGREVRLAGRKSM